MDGEEKNQDEKKSKIPTLKLKNAVEKAKKEREEKKKVQQPRRSSIPKLKDAKKVIKRGVSLNIEPKIEDEFDKLYEEMIEKGTSENLPVAKIEAEIIETKFEELIHAYDEDENVKHSVSRVSKIPALRRHDEGSKTDKAKDRSTDNKLRDGGFKVTTIKTKRFSRGSSRDLSTEETQIVTETIDVNNDVFIKEAVKSAPVKPERSLRNVTKRIIKDERKVDQVELVQSTEDVKNNVIITDNVERRHGRKITRVISREVNEENLRKNLDEIRMKRFSSGIANVDVEEFDDDASHVVTETTVKENVDLTPTEQGRIMHNISREFSKDGQSVSNTEVVTVEDVEGGGTRTTTTITTESVKIGTPVVTERIIRNISREISTEKVNDKTKVNNTVDNGTEEGSKAVTKEVTVKENVTGIPVRTERFTRGISREMGNFRQKSVIEAAESNITSEVKKTEENVPAFTKITRSFSKGKIQNVAMSRTVEWKPAEVKTKSFSRSVSERITNKEIKDDNEKYDGPTITEVTDENDENIDTTQEITQNADIETRIKDTANKTKRITEYKTEEQVTNEERTTFTLKSNVDLSIDRDFKTTKEYGTPMSWQGPSNIGRSFVTTKEFGTQMSVQSKTVENDKDLKISNVIITQSKANDSPLKNDFKAATEINKLNIDHKINDTEFKTTKTVSTQMSFENKEISTQVSVESNKENIILTEKSEKKDNGFTKQERDENIEATVLKGNVSRIKDMIVKEGVVVSKKETAEEVPLKKSVLSKIAIFERLDHDPVIELPPRKIKCKYVPPTLQRNNSEDKPKIVDELLKDTTEFHSLTDIGKVEIDVYNDEVSYFNEPVIVKEHWKTEEGDGDNVSAVNRVVTDKKMIVEAKQAYWEAENVLPAVIDNTAEESKVEIIKTVDDAPLTPQIIDLPTIYPSKINYEADIGKTKPGKLNLNNWSYQVEVNKSSVDKVSFFRRESLEDIAKTLPVKVDFKVFDSQVLVSDDLQENFDVKTDDKHNQAKVLPAPINFDTEEIHYDILEPIENEHDSEGQSGSYDFIVDELKPVPEKTDFITYETHPNVATTLPAAVEITYPIELVDKKDGSTKPKPGKLNLNLWKNQVEANKTFVGTTGAKKNKDLLIATGVAKVDFKAYHKQVTETVQSNNVLNKKEYKVETARTLPERINFSPNSGQIEADNVQVNKIEIDSIENQIQYARTLPAVVHFSNDEIQDATSGILPESNTFNKINSQIETARILPARIEFSTSYTEIQEASTMPEVIDYSISEYQVQEPSISNVEANYEEFVITESTAEIKETVHDKVYYSNTENVSEKKTKPKVGKLNLKAWENQVEANKIRVRKVNIGNSGSIDNIAKTLPAKINFTSIANDSNKKQYREVADVQELDNSGNFYNVATTLPAKINYTYLENDINAESDPKLEHPDSNIDFNEVAATLPAKINYTYLENDINAESGPKLEHPDSNVDFNEVAATLPEKINFTYTADKTNTENYQEIVDTRLKFEQVANTLPGSINFENLANDQNTEITDFNKSEDSKIHFDDIATTLPAKINFAYITNESDMEQYPVISETNDKVGKLDLKAWESQLETNKISIVKNEVFDATAKTLPEKINVIYADDKETVQNYPETIEDVDHVTRAAASTVTEISEDSNIVDNKVEITEITKSEPNTLNKATVLPGKIDFDLYKPKHRLNHFPIIIPMNTREKALGDAVQINKDFINTSNKLEIPVDTRDSLSDPELVDEDPDTENNINKDAIIGNIKSKLYFMSKTNTIQNSTIRSLKTEVSVNNDNNNEENVFSSKTPEKDNTREYQLNYSVSMIENQTYESEIRTDLKRAKSLADTTEMFTTENEFNLDKHKVDVTRSEYGDRGSTDGLGRTKSLAELEYASTDGLEKSKSLAELDLGDLITGQVKRIVGRLKSIDFGRRESIKTEIQVKELPKKMSVLEKIALFEGKSTATAKYETTTTRTVISKKPDTAVVTEEMYIKKIEELTSGKTKYGRLNDMLYIPLADGHKMPVIALGTALMDPRLLPYVIGAAIDLGYRAIDTGYIYGNEKEIGQGIKAKIDDGTVRREELFIISKLWSTFHRPDLVETACRASLQNMGLEYFDLFLIHNPMSFKEGPDPIPKIATVMQYSECDYLDAWYGMEGLVTKNLVRSIGVSNFNSHQIQRILDKGKTRPVVNQVECHPYLNQQRLSNFCAERNIILSCFGVLGSKGTPAEFKDSTTAVIDDALVKVMASGLGVTPAQMLIRYQIQKGHNVVAKASSASHLWENLQAMTFQMNQTEIDALDALNVNRRTFTFKGMGDTHKNYPFLALY